MSDIGPIGSGGPENRSAAAPSVIFVCFFVTSSSSGMGENVLQPDVEINVVADADVAEADVVNPVVKHLTPAKEKP